MKSVRVLVSGRVQGVMYRDSCRQEAERLGVAGSARNEPDGSVVVEAEGEEEAVDALVEWCRTGPPAARVTDVEVSPRDEVGARGFEVRW